ncbi:MAG TPA: NAD(P)-dependent oxidoreductase [Acidobacteriota bacterium]|nr:NAD(P)-dependent oxidoreductase [Acidobacteriota bacterium]
MNQTAGNDSIIGPDHLILVTGASGFIGSRLVAHLIERGFRNIRCFARSSPALGRLEALCGSPRNIVKIEVMRGNLLSRDDCTAASASAAVIYHLAAGRGEKSIPDAFLNSVVTTRNLMEASLRHHCLRRFVNVSSFTVYTNTQKRKGRLLDETCPVEQHPEERGDAYSFAKAKQEEIVIEYGRRCGLPYVIVRPGYVYGPGNEGITGRVGVSTFGIFLHLGGSNKIPFTFVDNCAEAIALAGLKHGIDGEIFNVVDDDLPSSRQFLRQYKKNVRDFPSIYVPHAASYALCYFWERYYNWSQGQLPPAFNRRVWHASWKKTRYSNEKVKSRLGWAPKVPMAEGLRRHFKACRDKGYNA